MKTNFFLIHVTAILAVCLVSCTSEKQKQKEADLAEGKILADKYCTTCHAEVTPDLLDKRTWVLNIMPQMGPRMGMMHFEAMKYKPINPILMPVVPALSEEQWGKIINYYYAFSPDSLPKQKFDRIPQEQCPIFEAQPFSAELSGNSVITFIKADEKHGDIYAGDAISNTMFRFGLNGKLKDSLHLESPATGMEIREEYLDITMVGILHPNNEDKGIIARYPLTEPLSSASHEVIIEKLFRPVYSISFDFNYDGREDYLACEYGNDIGRLVLYLKNDTAGYAPKLIEEIAGSIVAKMHDFNKDGFVDLMVLFAQGDERLVIYYNDGKGNFRQKSKVVARFPSVYGSMYFDLFDFNHDGDMDIIYVNGDNFDYSQILKPYHGIRILQNDRKNNFTEKYFFPVYGAGRVAIKDFDLDGDADIVVVSNFADMDKNPERGIIYLQNEHLYEYIPYSIPEAAQNQWNTMEVVDVDADGDMDVLVGAMNLNAVLASQGHTIGSNSDQNRTSLLLLKNLTR